MIAPADAAAAPIGSRRVLWWSLVAGIFLLALGVRLVPVLRGGGLYALGNYDDGVHYAAATGLIHGLLPYRDFLLLQPPGIVVLLTPFAAIGWWLGDPVGLLVGRLAFMIIGSLTAVLIARWLRSLGFLAAALGGCAYALFPPGAYVERSTLLEGPGNTLLVIALLLLSRARTRPHRAGRLALGAGAALGLAAAIKIWMVVPAAVVIGWLLITRGWRPALRVSVGGLIIGTLVAVPFLIAAPGPMVQMVVRDQLGRPRIGTGWDRLINITGLSPWGLSGGPSLTLGLVCGALLVAFVLACTVARGRLPGLLLIATSAVLLLSPSEFWHYGAYVAAPLALVIGAGSARLLAFVRAVVRVDARGRRRRGGGGGRGGGWVPSAVALLLLVGLLVWTGPALTQRWGRSFPAAELRPVAAASPGCLVTDDPSTLIQLDLLTRDLERGCPFVVDLSGYSYHPPLAAPVARAANEGWQRFALERMRAADLVLLVRLSEGRGFSAATAREIRSWPVVADSGRYRLRAPAG